jgi:hypothetical protein
MLIDGVNLAEGSNIANAVIGSGPTLPQTADKGEIFYQDGTGLFVYSGTAWTKFLSSGESTFTSPVVAPSFSGAGTNLTGTAANLNIGGNAATATTAGSATANVLKAGDTMTGALTLSGAPTQALHAATKAYVDAVAQGLDPKASVRVATTANITLSGTQTIDGVAVVAGDRVLVKNQTTGSQNGIYVVATGAWTRAIDADSNAKVTPGMYTFVEDGTVGSASGWNLITKAPITVGTTALVFSQFNAATSYTAGTNVTIAGNVISVANSVIPYDVAGAVFGKPAASAVVMRFVAVRSFVIPSFMTGTRATSSVNSTGTAAFNVLKNGAAIATITFAVANGSTGVLNTSASGNAAVTFNAGDILTVTAPSTADATLADIQFTFLANLA